MSRCPIKVLFDANPLLGNKTGVGYYTAGLISALSERYSANLELVGYYSSPRQGGLSKLPSGPNISYRRSWISSRAINLLRRLRVNPPIELLTLTKADFLLYTNFLGLPSLFKAPCAPTIHDLTFIDLPDYVTRKNQKDLRAFVPQSIKRAAFVITVSDFSKKRLCEEYNLTPERVLVTPIPPRKKSPAHLATEKALLRKLGVTGKFLLTVGTVEPRKNVPNMLSAYLSLPKKLQDYTFVIAGNFGWDCERERTALSKLKAAGKNIIHAGYVTDDERAALYHHATFFTCASHYEGFGMPILEAMSYGTPCAISDIPVFHEAAADTALYFNQTKPREIAAAWTRLLTNPTLRKNLAAAGKERADSYQWDEVADSLYQMIVISIREAR